MTVPTIASKQVSDQTVSKPVGSQLPAELTALHGVGPALAARLKKLNVQRPEDLLFVLPQRYEDRTRIAPIGSLVAGRRAVVEAEVDLAEVVYRRRRSLLCRVSDGTGQLTLRFFYFSRAQQNKLARGQRIRCYGDVRSGPTGMEMIHPEYLLLPPDEPPPLEQHLTPVYPTTEGLQQFRLRKLTTQTLERYLHVVPDWLPQAMLQDLSLPGLHEAIELVHRPPRDVDLGILDSRQHPSQRRLALEEILAHHLSLRRVHERSEHQNAITLKPVAALRDRFLANLGFELTGDQHQALSEIDTDLARPHPMMRLLQGDVGCGKTVLAAAAALTGVSGGHQAAVMAPTELLAEQLRDNMQKWLKPLGITVAWLSGALTGKATKYLCRDRRRQCPTDRRYPRTVPAGRAI